MSDQSKDWRSTIQGSYVAEAPSPQHAVSLVEGWTCRLPSTLGVQSGSIDLFSDPRVHWALKELGGVSGSSVLELGPLEAAHTYMLHEAGAASITAIEANRLCYMKCLIVKELLGIARAKFLLGNFIPYLQQMTEQVDMIWAAGVLYHMTEPLKLIADIGRLTGRTHIWTHYVPDDGVPAAAPWAQPIRQVDVRNGVEHYVRSYFDQGDKATYCGGVYMASAWLKRGDILAALGAAGFDQISIGFEAPDHPHGPAFAIAAKQTALP